MSLIDDINTKTNAYFDEHNLVEYLFVGWSRLLSVEEKVALIKEFPHKRKHPIGIFFEDALVTASNDYSRVERAIIHFDAERRAFTGAMLNIYRRALEEANYRATYFLNMVNERGGFETAMELIHSSRPSEGYAALQQRGHLELTVEALILSPRWRDLFTDEDRQAAHKRLSDYEFPFPEDSWQPPKKA